MKIKKILKIDEVEFKNDPKEVFKITRMEYGNVYLKAEYSKVNSLGTISVNIKIRDEEMFRYMRDYNFSIFKHEGILFLKGNSVLRQPKDYFELLPIESKFYQESKELLDPRLKAGFLYKTEKGDITYLGAFYDFEIGLRSIKSSNDLISIKIEDITRAYSMGRKKQLFLDSKGNIFDEDKRYIKFLSSGEKVLSRIDIQKILIKEMEVKKNSIILKSKKQLRIISHFWRNQINLEGKENILKEILDFYKIQYK